MMPSPTATWLSLAGEVGQVLHVHVVEARAGGVDGLDQVGVGARGVADIDAESDARIEILDGFEHVERRREELVLGPVIVDGDADVVFLDELLDPIERFRRRVAGDDDVDAGALAVFELGADVGFVIFGKVDGSGGVELDAGGGVVSERLGFLHGSMGR